MRITVVGGGNIGTLLAADCARIGHDVWVYTSSPDMWRERIEVFDANDALLFDAPLRGITSDLGQAVSGSELIWITHPVNVLPDTARRLLPYVQPGQVLCVAPGACAEFLFADHVAKGCVLLGLQRVHSVARIKEKGKSVYELGRKKGIFAASIPSSSAMDLAPLVSELTGIPVDPLPNYLPVTLVPSNSILHTARIRSMFDGWEPGITYDHNFLFYEEWTLDASRRMLACDGELHRICDALPELDLEGVVPLAVHYESPTAEEMTRKISSIRAFRGLRSPMIELDGGGWAPDFESRYFKADFAFGLGTIQSIARAVDVATPCIDETLAWYRRVSGDSAALRGVPETREKLLALYR